MDSSGNNPFQFHIVMVDNRTFYASVIGKNKTLQDLNLFHKGPYDDEGALYYVVAVLCIYAFSIILMIGSVIKKSKHDNGVTKYMKGMDRIRRIERREQKFKIRVAVLGRNNSQRAARIKLNLSQDDIIKQRLSAENQFEMAELKTNVINPTHNKLCNNMQNQKENGVEDKLLKSNDQDKITIENECNQDSSFSKPNNPALPAYIDADGERITLSSTRMDTLQEVDEDVISV